MFSLRQYHHTARALRAYRFGAGFQAFSPFGFRVLGSGTATGLQRVFLWFYDRYHRTFVGTRRFRGFGCRVLRLRV